MPHIRYPHLRQLSDLDHVGDPGTNAAANGHACSNLAKDGTTDSPLQSDQSCANATSHTNHTQGSTCMRAWLYFE